jgi:hypothetical protein
MQDANLMYGLAELDGSVHHGWFVGNYSDFPGLRHTQQIQVKWKDHTHDDDSPVFKCEPGLVVTLGILIKGKVRIEFERQGSGAAVDPVELSSPGQYAIWREDKFKHKNSFLGLTTVLTVRWKELEKTAAGGSESAPLGA